MIALTRPVSPSLADCELTHLERVAIDVEVAARQHAGYEELLRSLGAVVVEVPAAPTHPDAVFLEDTAIVLDEVAVMTRPGALSRRGELPDVSAVLSLYRPLVVMTYPATLDGGDVIRCGRTLYVGCSGRTNQEGIDQLQQLLETFDYRIVAVPFSGCLHLKSAATAIAGDAILLNPEWVSPSAFEGREVVAIDPHEPSGANALRLGATLVYGSQFPRTHEILRNRGYAVAPIDLTELAKAEGAVTCCSLIIDDFSSVERA